MGVGTTTPASQLDISASDSSSTVFLRNNSSTGARFPSFYAVNYTGGNGGAPGVTLRNSRGSSATPAAISNGDQIGYLTAWGQYDTAVGNILQATNIVSYAEGNFSNTSAPGAIAFLTTPVGGVSPAERLRINNVGNVGIGTSIPGERLHVFGGNAKIDNVTNAALAFWGGAGYYGGIGTVAGLTGAGSSTEIGLVADANRGLHFYTNTAANERMTILSNGNVGIGTASPGAKFNVVGDAAIDGAFFVRNATSTGDYGRILHSGAAGNLHLDSFTGATYLNWYGGTSLYVGRADGVNSALYVRSSDGNVGIGTTAPTSLLQTSDSQTITSGSYSSSYHDVSINPGSASSADVYANNLRANYTSSSDSTGSVMALTTVATNNGTGSVNIMEGAQLTARTNSGNVTIMYGSNSYITANSASTVTTGTAVNAQVYNQSSGVITNASGLGVGITNSGAGSITNGYGVNIGTIQATNKWSVYAADSTAPSYFAGNVGIGTTNPGHKLDVRASFIEERYAGKADFLSRLVL